MATTETNHTPQELRTPAPTAAAERLPLTGGTTGTATDAAPVTPQPGAGTTHSRLAFGVIVLATVVLVPLVAAPLTFSSDIWRQADTASIAHNFLEHGFRLFYPQINWGGSGPGYVESEFQLYPFVVAVLYRLAGEELWWGRLVSLAFSTGTLMFFWGLAKRVLHPRPALIGLVFFSLCPLWLRYSTAFMPEATVLCFYVASLYFFQRWLDEDRTSMFLLAGSSVALALLVKPTSINIALAFFILVFSQRERFARRSLWVVAGLSLVPGTLWFIHARNLHEQYGNTFGVISGGDQKFGNLKLWTSLEFYTGTTRIELLWIFAFIAAPVFLVGLVIAMRRRQPLVLVAGAVTIPIYYAITARYSQGQAGIQYHVYAIPYAALGVGLGLDWLWRHADRAQRGLDVCFRVVLAGACAVFLVISGVSYARLFPEHGQALTNCAGVVAELVPPDDLIIVSSNEPARDHGFVNNYQEPMMFFYSDRRGWSLASDQHNVARVESMRADGARWFVAYRAELLRESPQLMNYLERTSLQLGPGIDAGCGVFRL